MIVDISNPNTMMLISLIENVQRVDIDDRDRTAASEKLVEATESELWSLTAMGKGLPVCRSS